MQVASGRKIEIQTCHQVELYNVDARQDQRYMAEQISSYVEIGMNPGSAPTLKVTLTSLEIQVAGDPSMSIIH